jgi:hypothetical protein
MTAQIIDLAARREVIRRRNDQYALGLLWPGIFVSCAAFWFGVGVAAVRAWPLVRVL